jgi:hypothetical protein
MLAWLGRFFARKSINTEKNPPDGPPSIMSSRVNQLKQFAIRQAVEHEQRLRTTDSSPEQAPVAQTKD